MRSPAPHGDPHAVPVPHHDDFRVNLGDGIEARIRPVEAEGMMPRLSRQNEGGRHAGVAAARRPVPPAARRPEPRSRRRHWRGIRIPAIVPDPPYPALGTRHSHALLAPRLPLDLGPHGAGGRLAAGGGDELRDIADERARFGGGPEEIARDERLWAPVQQAFTVDRSIINLNNAGVSPSPRLVQEATKRHLDYSNQAPVHTMWRVLEPQRESVRTSLARMFFGLVFLRRVPWTQAR